MKLLLVNPPMYLGKMPVGREDRCENTIPNVIPPTGLVYLGGLLLEKGYKVDLVDANGYKLSFEDIKYAMEKEIPDFLIFRATPETFYEDLKVADIAKKISKNIKTVMICWSLSTVFEDVMKRAENVDYYITDFYYERPVLEILGNKEIKEIRGLSYREDGVVRVNSPNNKPFDFNSIPMPAWHLIKDFSVYWVQIPSFSPWTFVTATKGCGMGCTFCTIADIKPSFREAKKVVDEIEYLYKERGLRYISFFDATFNISKKRVFEICEELVKRELKNLKWFANVRANITKEEADIMKQTGCEGVSIGIESGSQKILNLANKKIKVAETERSIKVLKEAGIKQYASFIVGLPGETLETMNQTRNFILKTKPTGFQVNSLVPYPRSKVYDLAVQQGKIKELKFEDLLLYDAPVNLSDGLSIREINEFRKKIYKDVYLNPGWWLSNLKETMKNPKDIKLGAAYALKVFRRLVRGMDYEN